MMFSYQTVTGGLLLALAGAEYWRTRRGPLVLLALAVLHARAFLLCVRRLVPHLVWYWRVEYRFAIRDVKEQG